MKRAKFKKTLLICTLASSAMTVLALSGCSEKAHESDGKAASSQSVIMGSGSSFIYPAMSRWANEYYNQTGVKINYQPIGSGGGQRQIFAGTVNFAASDQPLNNAELSKYNLLQFPAIVGGIVPVINVQGIKTNELVLSGQVLADIYLGKIQYWNDPAIVALNPKLKLPHNAIITVHRADGSGTTYNFTQYLASVNPVWQKQVGVDTSVQWPVGIGAKGNQGVAAQVQQVDDSIGYVEYAYAKTANIPTVKLINQSGQTVTADLNSFASAAKYASWQAKDNYNLLLVNQPGNNSWPIVATTFVLLPEKAKQGINQDIKQFFTFAYSEQGDKIAQKLDYVGIPQNVVAGIKVYWDKV
ncbi:phosphate ABC transporter substrate-binding protein PstS [Cysteiniphilum sp. QT6929]|uniref:phosphate ABC transporter substrate-binding protein PstS n=1 Tax=Cysteiniphilum sp. QT6929 TaxID=2975055 RepID=UPI0024B343BB|nr:phosphate ABC transporter substrate-binding protein PstS [Cysteiniphilum sp. QT6929]WHN65931.1 phosphate ABC transporter substrate-binding protein PstS [Cysteiniphilum sp. QT6929]